MNMRTIFGLVLIALGGLYILDTMEIIDFSIRYLFRTWWPMLIVFWGVNELRKGSYNLTWALLSITAGILLQANNLDYLPFRFWEIFLPASLIIVGISFLLKPKRKDPDFDFDFDINHHTSKEDFITLNCVFSGQDEKVISKSFKGAKLATVFGGIELDLTEAEFDNNAAHIQSDCVFGAVSIRVPHDVKVVSSGTPVFGAMENKTRPRIEDPENVKILHLKFNVVFGGIEVK